MGEAADVIAQVGVGGLYDAARCDDRRDFAERPSACCQFGPPPTAQLSVEKLARIDEFLIDQVAQGEIPGAIVLIQRRGKPVYFKWFGKRDADAGIDMTPDTIFTLHSLTKTVTSLPR
jgi:CubicO group peptidase (beta-lactamase class C family)